VTDRPDDHAPADPGLTPEQERHVRHLLVDARHTGPTPDDVVARLDRVLADLATEPAREAAVVRLADRRRRAGRMLVAAAAVVVLGVGVNEVVDLSGGSAGSDSATTGGEAASEDSAESPEAADNGADLLGEGARDATRTRPFRLRAEDFSRDAAELQAVAPQAASGGTGEEEDGLVSGSRSHDHRQLSRARPQEVCEPGDWGRGGLVPVLYDGAPGWVVLRPVRGETQVADLFLCGSEQTVRSVTLPVR